MAEPSPAPPRPKPFDQTAAGALAPVAGNVETVKNQAAAGSLRIDLDAATVLLRQLEALKNRAGDLVKDSGELDLPLRFGDSWVGQIMSERMRTVAVSDNGGVTPVLRTFHKVLEDLEATIRFAAGMYQTADEETVEALKRAAGQFGVEIGSEVR
jgi:hypothetical protein